MVQLSLLSSFYSVAPFGTKKLVALGTRVPGQWSTSGDTTIDYIIVHHMYIYLFWLNYVFKIESGNQTPTRVLKCNRETMSETGGNYLFSHRTKKKKKCVYDLAISEKINGTDSPSEESNLNGVFNGEEHKKYVCSLDSSDNLYKSLIPYTIFLFLHNVYFMMFFLLQFPLFSCNRFYDEYYYVSYHIEISITFSCYAVFYIWGRNAQYWHLVWIQQRRIKKKKIRCSVLL